MEYDTNAALKSLHRDYVYSARPINDMFSVKGKVALVTGGTSGLGFNIALRLLQGGANVVVASNSDKEAEIAMPLFEKEGHKDEVRFTKLTLRTKKVLKPWLRLRMQHLVRWTFL